MQGTDYLGGEYNLDTTLQANRQAALTGSNPADGTWVVVNFFASWCVGCIDEHPDLARLHQESVVGPCGACGATPSWSASRSTTMPTVLPTSSIASAASGRCWVGDGTSTMAIDYSVLTVPETLVISPSGIVVQKWAGAVSYDQLVEAIRC